MTQFSVFKSIIVCMACFALFSCQSDDDSANEYHSSFKISNMDVEYPIFDYYAFLDEDSTLTLSTFSTKIAIEGFEDEIEDVYKKYNIAIKLNNFNEGEYDLIKAEANVVVDTLFYSYSSIPYRQGLLTLDIDRLEENNSFIYLKQIIHGRDLVSGNFNIRQFIDDTMPDVDSNIQFHLEGSFLNVPFTKK